MQKNWNAIRQFRNRNLLLKEKGFKDYQDFLKSAEWAETKRKFAKKVALGKQSYSCFCCGSLDNLQLHHLKYNNLNLSGKVGNYLKYVCEDCHKTIHLITKLCARVSIKTATMIWKSYKSLGVIKPSYKRLMGLKVSSILHFGSLS